MANCQPTLCLSLSLLLLLLCSKPVNSQQPQANISLGSSLAAGASQDYWLSPSGDFAFGFQQVTGGGRGNSFLLAIWFNRIPQRTVVWSANRNELVPDGSTIKLTEDGNLILTKDGSLMLADPSGRQVWGPNGVGPGVSYGVLYDTGNFVLTDRKGVVLWGSFDQPTDTILPTQIMKKGTEVISKYSSTNYSTGRFKFMFQTDGNLVAYTTFYPQTVRNYAYWASATKSTGNSVTFNESGSVFLSSDNGTILLYVFTNQEPTQDLHQRLTIDHDGVIRLYAYPKQSSTSAGRRWPAEWTALSFTPADICGLMRADTGSGACGFNSYCQIEDAQFPNCKCPNGYKFLDPSDESRGCLKTFPPQDCSSSAGEEDGQFDLVEMVNTIFPSGDYEYYQSISEDMCRDLCLSDCLCDAVTYESASCWKKRAPLTNGYMDQENTGKTLLKIRRQNSTYSTAGERKKNDQSRKLMATAGWVLLGSSVFVNLMFIVGSCPWRKKNRRMNRVGDESDEAMESANLQRFTYREMESATGGFKQVLGSGASGTVYKGVLGERAGELVAVKVLDNMPERDGHDVREFATEVKIIGGTNHKNLVKLVGYCNEGQHLLLVYEFMSNGSLADSLFGGGEGTFPRPNWYTRTQIAYSVARGLVYLHDECSTQIIHCDIKPQNILLDQGMTARISDFGISKLMKTDQTRTTTAIRGTKGYLAPEWFRNVPVTAKVDVHSFGIVLLELVCCRKSFLLDFEKEEEMVLVDWAYDCYSRGKLYKLVEKDEDAMEDLKKVERFVKVALWCIQEDPSLRPGMKKVVHMLEGAVLVSEPPDPSSFMSAI
ncbi:unnamed protein product [Linum tenue]|uniref:Receptor-like serine/threonine-protein kinase n=1 Tax=Linum tenue TaxID=586396 RepID=A0AAV0MU15_9ROSI|nr:unnamed protein product [Linum tenue]